MPLLGDGRSGTFSALPSLYGGAQAGAWAVPVPVYPASVLLVQPSPPVYSGPPIYRDGSLIGDGQSVVTPTVDCIIPATAQVGDVAVVSFDINVATGTFTTPTGWTLISGPDTNPSPSGNAYLFGKTLVGGDPGSTVTFTYSETRRIVGACAVFAGVTLTGLVFGVLRNDSVTTSAALPSVGSVPAGAMLIGAWDRRSSTTTAPAVALPAGWSQGPISKTTYATSTNHTTSIGYLLATSAGTYGGDVATVDNGVGVNYLLALPASNPGPSAAGSITLGATVTATASTTTTAGGITLGGSPAPVAVASAAGSVTLGGTPAAAAVATATGTITLSGSGITGSSTAVGNITLGATVTVRALATSILGSITLDGDTDSRAQVTAAGVLTLSGFLVVVVPATATLGAITLAGSAVGAAHVPHIYVYALLSYTPSTAILASNGVGNAILDPQTFTTADLSPIVYPTATLAGNGTSTATLTSNGVGTAVVSEDYALATVQLT